MFNLLQRLKMVELVEEVHLGGMPTFIWVVRPWVIIAGVVLGLMLIVWL